ncbi:cholesterol 25-hydroxylase-like protein [Gadus chalcogrammus]|uniref:cholesterol 25-hydroxylase-like protein n=1 Tax=Gadus chalcogrammus TaxID=1042646 RepID=UPI0024C4832D|nr:cholesterol 25-hydroxylase-like protein [Gadus chalcogrammus]
MQSHEEEDVGLEAVQGALQPIWDAMLGHRDVLTSPLTPGLSALIIHLVLCAPFFLLDVLACVCPRVHSYQISESTSGKRVLRNWSMTLKRILVNYAAVIVPFTAVLQSLTSPRFPLLAPTCLQLCVHVVLCVLLFDLLFFAWHWAMHRFRWLFLHVHLHHHRHHPVPIALAAQDAGAAEVLSQLLLALGTARLLGLHPLSEAAFHLLNSWLAVEDHCGYRLPWGLQGLLPRLGAGAPHHQLHHSLQKGNYAPYFTIWDRLLGTEL